MLTKYSVLMMVLIVTASLVGISSIMYKPANVQAVPCGYTTVPPYSTCTGEMAKPSGSPCPKGYHYVQGTGCAKDTLLSFKPLQKLTPNATKALGKGQVLKQQTGITGTLVGKILSFINYASSDGKACIEYATISERAYYPNYPLGLKPGDSIALLVPDQTMCVLLGQANIAKIEIGFRVALPPVTVKELPPYIQQNFPPTPNQPLYRIVLFYVLPP
jgi:hypothetical protein